jgi:arylsulfatase A-like enzyme
MVIVTLDTTRSDFLGSYGSTLGLTPRLDELAQRGVVFEQVYAPMPQTLPSHATLFTGLMPRTHGALENTYTLPPEMETLAERAAARGYATGGFIGALAIDRVTGIHQGFETWGQPGGDWGEDRLGHPPQRRAKVVTDEALAWAGTLDGDEPFLLWAHYYDPHGDSAQGFNPPRRVWKEMDRGQVGELVASRAHLFTGPSELGPLTDFWTGYSAELVYTDEQVGRLLDGLADLGLADDTLVLVVADHGEGLWEHGVKAHGTHLWEEAMRVPMILVDPAGTGAGTRMGGRVILQDIDPTLRHAAFGERVQAREELLGIDLWQLLLDGREPPERPVVLERPHFDAERIQHRKGEVGFMTALLQGDLKLIREPDGSVALFDLAADPDELVDVSAGRPDDTERMRGWLEQWLGRNTSAPPGSAEITPERMKDLEALGYMGGDDF